MQGYNNFPYGQTVHKTTSSKSKTITGPANSMFGERYEVIKVDVEKSQIN